MIRIALLVDGNESLSPGGIDAAARGVEIQIVHYADTGQAGDQLVRPQVEHQQTRRLACPPAASSARATGSCSGICHLSVIVRVFWSAIAISRDLGIVSCSVCPGVSMMTAPGWASVRISPTWRSLATAMIANSP